MPDLDYFRKYCIPAWRKASRLSMNANSDIELADACVRASARTLRESGECYGLTEIATIIDKFELETISFPLFMSGDYSFVLFSGVTNNRMADIQRNIKKTSELLAN
jgi:hypothetical protein